MRKKTKKKNKLLLLLLPFIFAIFLSLESDFYNNLKTNLFPTLEESQQNYEETLSSPSTDLTVYFLDVGQADSIMIGNDNQYMLIDAGNNEDGEKLVTYFQNKKIEKFSYIVATHPHEDHIGGMDDIINNFDVENFYMPDVVTTTKTFEDVLDALEQKSLYFETPEIGSNFQLGNAKIEVIYVGNDSSDLNSSSIVLKLTYGEISFLFTGDATSEVESTIINKNLNSNVLKVAHHGSKYSSNSTFLNKVNPQYAIVSVGANNSYNHPDDIVLERLKKMNTQIYRTDESGTIIFKTDGKNIDISTEKTDTNGNE